MSYEEGDDFFEITVVHVRKHPDAFPIHRGFPLGNPFPMNGDESLRDEVCDQYEEYFWDKVNNNDRVIMTELARATAKAYEQGYIKLGCYCAPKRCHGLPVARFLNSVLNPQSDN
jgi:hypothetical protein